MRSSSTTADSAIGARDTCPSSRSDQRGSVFSGSSAGSTLNRSAKPSSAARATTRSISAARPSVRSVSVAATTAALGRPRKPTSGFVCTRSKGKDEGSTSVKPAFSASDA